MPLSSPLLVLRTLSGSCISLLCSLGDLSGEDEQLADSMKSCRTASHVYVRIWVLYFKNPPYRGTRSSFKLKKDPTESYLESCDLPPLRSTKKE
nr:hypothetical transcript [Hymenolepis microstoma]